MGAAPDSWSQFVDRSGEVKRAVKNMLLRIKAVVVDLNFVAAVNGRLGAVGQGWATKKNPGVVVGAADAPLHREHEVLEYLARMPEQSRAAMAFNHTITDLTETARSRHAPTGKVGGQKLRRLCHAHPLPLLKKRPHPDGFASRRRLSRHLQQNSWHLQRTPHV
jgi:hypothetical protein